MINMKFPEENKTRFFRDRCSKITTKQYTQSGHQRFISQRKICTRAPTSCFVIDDIVSGVETLARFSIFYKIQKFGNIECSEILNIICCY